MKQTAYEGRCEIADLMSSIVSDKGRYGNMRDRERGKGAYHVY
jgi:hypothetical protein